MIYAGLYLALAMAAGIIAAETVCLPVIIWIVFSVSAAAGAVLLRQHWQYGLALLLVCSFCCGAARLTAEQQTYDRLPVYLAGETLYLEGTVKEKKNSYVTEKGEMSRYVLHLESFSYPDGADRQRVRGNIYVTMPSEESIVPAERIGLWADVRALRYYQNPGQYDAYHRDREQHIFLTAYQSPGKPVQILESPRGWRHMLRNVREYLTRTYQNALGWEKACILSSLLFGGHYDDLPPSLLESFSITGLIHILSVSGSHMALLLAAVQMIGRAARLEEKALFILSVLFILLYGALSEFTAPVVRSAIMGIVSAGSLLARRQYTGHHALALAILAMLLYSPWLVYDLSFRLSCGAAAGIVLLQRPVSGYLSFLPVFLCQGITVCLCAQLLLIPLLLASFFSLPLYSLAANLTVGPVLDLVILLGLLASLISLILPPAGQLLLHGVGPLISLAVKGNYFLSSLPHSRVFLEPLAWYGVITYYLLLGALFFIPRKRQQLLLAAVLVCTVPALYHWHNRPEYVVRSYDLGNDRAVCVIDDDSSACLWYNKSQWSNPEQAVCVLLPALRYDGIFTLKQLTVSGFNAEKTSEQLQHHYAASTVVFPEKQKQHADLIAAATAPYYLYMGELPKTLPQGAVVEVFSLKEAGRTAFPNEAAALILHRNGTQDRLWKHWREQAALHDIPCFTPELDGMVKSVWHRGSWQQYTAGGNDETNKGHIWQRILSD